MSKLDLFGLLDKVDANEPDAYSNLSDEERKDFAPIVVMRWLSSSMDKTQLVHVNDFANRYVFQLYKHPELLYKVFVATTPPKKHYYKWLPRKKKEKLTKKIDVICRHLDCSTKDARRYLATLSKDDIIEMSMEMGDPSNYITDLKAEFK